jgi:thiosulfate/3-mercaptopyruvate sulfurtransferase
MKPAVTWRTLVSTAVVAEHLDDRGWVVIDCRFDLAAPERGEREYLEAHVPGAVYAHLDRDLSGSRTGTNGRHPLPTPDQLIATFRRLGIDATMQVVAYDQESGMWASRLWWLLRYMGHEGCAVLDGGFARWVKEGRPTRAGAEEAPRREFTGTPRDTMWLRVGDVERLIGDPARRIIDARAPDRYEGRTEPIDRVAGHIPGAVNHFFKQNLSPDGTFLPLEELRARLEATLDGVAPDKAISYCGSGVTACHNLLALEHAGLSGATLYAGSWSEWSSDAARPVETGPRSRTVLPPATDEKVPTSTPR